MQRTPGPSGRRGTRGRVPTAAAFARGCRTKPFRNRRCTLAEVGAREAEHDDIAPIGQRATEAVAVFGPHPYNGSSELVGRLCDSLMGKEQSGPSPVRPTAPLSRSREAVAQSRFEIA